MRNAVQGKGVQFLNLLCFEVLSEEFSKAAFRIKHEGRNRFAVLRDVAVESILYLYGDCNAHLLYWWKIFA